MPDKKKSTAIEKLQKELQKINKDRDALTVKARSLTKEIASLEAQEQIAEQLDKLTPDARAALKKQM